jgi:hypothetical protein
LSADNPTELSVAVYLTPQRPVVTNYAACPILGDLSMASLAKTTEGIIKWYADANGATTATAGAINKSVPSSITLYASVVSSNGCESEIVPVSATVYENPDIVDVDLNDLYNGQVIVEKGTNPFEYKDGDDVGFYGCDGLRMRIQCL